MYVLNAVQLTSCCPSRLDGNELWAITINGSAFLWHQVRCMVAVLFMIGQGVETPSVSMLNLQLVHNLLSNVIMDFLYGFLFTFPHYSRSISLYRYMLTMLFSALCLHCNSCLGVLLVTCTWGILLAAACKYGYFLYMMTGPFGLKICYLRVLKYLLE